jgi:hypothetical protein
VCVAAEKCSGCCYNMGLKHCKYVVILVTGQRSMAAFWKDLRNMSFNFFFPELYFLYLNEYEKQNIV